MTELLAVVRPDDWNFPLFVHVGGAMILVGATMTGAAALAFARDSEELLRLGYWTLLVVGAPGWVLMFGGAQWIYSKEGLDDAPIDSDWATIGFVVAEAGGLLFLLSLVAGGVGVYRLRDGKGGGLLKVTMAISIVLLAAYVVAVWAMSAKPD
jgi:hypothetical protein